MMEKIFDRKNNRFYEPARYKGSFLKWLHQSRFGRFLMNNLFSLPPVNNMITRNKYKPSSKKEIVSFIEEMSIDSSEFEKDVDSFTDFNDFFIRTLKPGARPADPQPNSIISPCDSLIRVWQQLEPKEEFSIKGRNYSLSGLLGSSSIAKQFKGGSMAVFYLSPADYHHFHYPVDCELRNSMILGNRLFSVNDLSILGGFNPFDNNIRHMNFLFHPHLSTFLMIEVGAFYVGRIHQSDQSAGEKKKGAEKGYFGLGGSTVVLLFKKGSVRFDQDLQEMSNNNIPVKVITGEKIGEIVQ